MRAEHFESSPTIDQAAFPTEHQYFTPDPIFLQGLLHLLQISEALYGQTSGVSKRLSREVAAITQNRVNLRLDHPEDPRPPLVSATVASFPLRFQNNAYGTLEVRQCLEEGNKAELSLTAAFLLASLCSLILHSLEQGAFIVRQLDRVAPNMRGILTKREQEVVTLMGQGYDETTISKMLNITPATVRKHRQHIYEQLGTHSEFDTVLVAHQAGIFSVLG